MEGLTSPSATSRLPSSSSWTCRHPRRAAAPELQLAVRDQLRAQLVAAQIDVRSKADLPLADRLLAERVPDALAVSVHEDAASVDALRCAMVDLAAAGGRASTARGDLPGETLA